jgi:hypothetical protein
LDFALSEYAVPVWELYNLAVEARGVDIGPMITRKRAIQSLDWKVIEPTVGVSRLYDLNEDANETAPLEAAAHEVGRHLLSVLDQRLGALPQPPLPPIEDPTELSEEAREALKALGYIQ